jgi:hypothetical protein
MPPDFSDVFGVSAKQVGSYVEREDVDRAFKEALKMGDQIVVYGASKQGKTSLVRRHLKPDSYITVNITPKTELIDIYRSILRQHGVVVETVRTDSTERSPKFTSRAKLAIKVPFLGKGEAEIGGDFEATKGQERQFEYIDFNLSLPQDVAELLKASETFKMVVIENFHYLTEARQREFAFDLRVFHDHEIRFIILGVWSEKNRLAQYNGDLQDRVLEITVEPWVNDDLRRIASKGCQLLSIDIDAELLARCIASSVGSVAVFQELMLELCRLGSEHPDFSTTRKLRLLHYLNKAIDLKCNSYIGRIQRSLELLIGGRTDGDSAFMAKTIIRALFVEEPKALSVGLDFQRLKAHVSGSPNAEAKDESYLRFLGDLGELQALANISPPLFDFDRESLHFRIVDLTFLFVLTHAKKQRFTHFLALL